MAYNSNNHIKTALYIISVYEKYKFDDVPDSHIVRVYFPKHNIYISYRQWMNIKAMKLPRAKLKDIKESIPLHEEYTTKLQIAN